MFWAKYEKMVLCLYMNTGILFQAEVNLPDTPKTFFKFFIMQDHKRYSRATHQK